MIKLALPQSIPNLCPDYNMDSVLRVDASDKFFGAVYIWSDRMPTGFY